MDVNSPMRRAVARILLLAGALLALSACSDDDDGAPAPTYTVGGLVSGTDVVGLRLTNNGGDAITVNAAGEFVFPARLNSGQVYDVQISQQPTSPAQTCTLSSNTGTVSVADANRVYVECSVLALSILEVTSTGPGQTPTVTFKVVRNGVPADIIASPLQSLRATLAGPTTDYASYTQATLQGSGASGTLVAIDAAQGIFSYTFSSAISPAASGSHAILLEGFVQAAPPSGTRYSAVTPVAYFAVTDAEVVSRRVVVEDARCNACHVNLTAHSTRRGVQSCVACHNPNAANLERVARVEGETIAVPSLDMKVMIHKIHRGAGLTVQPYLLWGFPAPGKLNPYGTAHDYGTVVFPGSVGECESCHRPGTYDVELPEGRLPGRAYEATCVEELAADTDSYCDLVDYGASESVRVPPLTAGCLACHDASHTAAHAATMTTSAGIEACATCHAIGAANGLERYHTITPAD